MQQTPAGGVGDDLSAFFDVSLDMLCIRDMQGRFVKASRSWEAVLGYPVEALIGAPMTSLIHPDDIAPSRAVMARADVQEEVVGFVNRYRHRDGRYRHLEWRARRFGEWVFGVARDVTDRLALEAQMQAARDAAEAANRTKSEFLANMSHEIRTPLNGVIGLIDALGRTELAPEQREMVDLVREAGVTLERLVSDILDVSKIEAGLLQIETRPFDLKGSLVGLIQTHQRRAQDKGLRFDVVFDPAAEGWYVGDSTRITQVLGNLLSNAVKFTTRGGVRLSVAADDAAGPGPAARVSFEVEDSGVGFNQEVGAALFQRFIQADSTITRRFGGTGLGLAICQALLALMGGEIAVQSEPGVGSLFRVDILMDRTAAPPTPRPVPAPASIDIGRPLRVLLAEDHPVNQKVVQLLLRPLGAEVTVVDDGAKAIEAFRIGAFDVVLMDMQMPVVDGLAATRALRLAEAACPSAAPTPIIMLSANAMRQHRRDARDAGADLHLAKPVTAAALLEAIREVIAAPPPAAP